MNGYMRSLKIALATALLLVAICTVSVPPARSQEPGFTETFDDPDLLGWEHSPEVAVVDGILRIPPGGSAFHGGDWGDLTLTVRARLVGEGAGAVMYRTSDAGTYIALIDSNSVGLQREAGGVVSELAGSPAPLPGPAGEWFQLSVTVTGGEHTAMFNGEMVLSATDPNPLPPGGVGFEVPSEALAEIDEIVVAPGVVTLPPATVETGGMAGGTQPAYQSLPWVRTGGPIGGIGYDIRYNFADPNVWYVTDALSGLYMSTDNGLTWFQSNQGIDIATAAGEPVSVFSATVDPINPNIVWIGTQFTGGIFKSTDGGYTWVRKTNGTDQQIAHALSFRGFTVYPNDSNIVYAMAEISSWGWTPDGSRRPGLGMDMTRGVVYKTTDGGETWREIWRGDNLARYCWVDPRNPNVLYVSTGIFDREAANEDIEGGDPGGVGILKSTDGGETWRVLNEANGLLDLFVGSLYMHPENPDILLAGTGTDVWRGLTEEFNAGVYLTEDGGEHWTQVVEDVIIGAVEFCVSNPNIAYAGSDGAFFRSDDGGHTWQRFSRPDGTWGPPGIVAGFPIDLQCDPRDPMRIFVNNYVGGNFLSEDGGQTWVSASKGYTGAQMLHAGVAPGEPAKVYFGGRSGLFRSDDGGSDWNGLANPLEGVSAATLNEISAVAVDPTNGDHALASGVDMPGVVYTHDGGQSWHLAPLPRGALGLVFAPSDPSTVYGVLAPIYCLQEQWGPRQDSDMATCDEPWAGLYVSRDGGTSWSPAGGEQASGRALIALAVDPTDPNTVYATRPTAELVKTTDGGQTWATVGSGLPSVAAVSFAIDPANPETILAGPAVGGVYRSTDGGQTWDQKSAGLSPEAVIRSIVIDPTNSQVVYAADISSGVCVSTDGGATWTAITDGMPVRKPVVLALSDDGTVLYAGIDGDGVYRLGTPQAVSP